MPSETFYGAVAYLSNSPALSKVANTTKLELYGLFKSVTVSVTPNTPRPYLFDITGRAKWDAWDEIGKRFTSSGLEAAEERYVEIAKSLGWEGDHTAGTASEEKHDSEGSSSGGMGVSVSSATKPPEENGEDIHSLAVSGNFPKLALLLNDPQLDVNERDQFGYTALHLSCDRGHTEIVKLLLEHDADTSIPDPDDFTVIELAEIAGHDEILTLFTSSRR